MAIKFNFHTVEKFCPGKQLLAFKEGLLHRVTVISLASSTQRLIGYSTVTEFIIIIMFTKG
jgi:hypothetical protein